MLRQQSQHLGSIAWIPPPTLQRVQGTLLDLISLNTLMPTIATVTGLGLAGLGALALVKDWRRPVLRSSYLFLICIVLAPLGISLLLSAGHSVFLTRTVLPALSGLLIFFARGIVLLLRPHRPWTLLAVVAALVPVLALNGASLHVAATTTIKEDWQSATRYMAERARPGDLLIFDPFYGQVPFDLYWSHYGMRTVERGYPHDSELLNASPQSMSTSRDMAQAAAGAHTIWLVIRIGPSIRRLSPSIMAWWSQHASFAGSKLFNQVTIATYSLRH